MFRISTVAMLFDDNVIEEDVQNAIFLLLFLDVQGVSKAVSDIRGRKRKVKGGGGRHVEMSRWDFNKEGESIKIKRGIGKRVLTVLCHMRIFPVKSFR